MACAGTTNTFHYNFVHGHTAPTQAAHGKPTTPAMTAGLADR